MPYSYGGCDRKELNSFDVFPEGTFDFYIESIQEDKNAYGDQIVEMVLKPSNVKEQRHGKIWHRISLENEWTRINIGRFLEAVGQDPEESCELIFKRFEGEHLRAKIKHKRGKEGKVFPNAYLLPRANGSTASDRARVEDSEVSYSHTGSLAQEWDGQAGADDDIPF